MTCSRTTLVMIFQALLITMAFVCTANGICPPNITEGSYGLWSTWSNCSTTCGGGTQWRSKGLCCPTVNGSLVDCRSTYNLTEVIMYDTTNCSQTCIHGKYVSGKCACTDGYTGPCCDAAADDCSAKICQNNGTCVKGVNTSDCACQTGFTGRNCETDINECDGDPCFNRGTCKDDVGNFKCTCPPEFTGHDCSIALKTMVYKDKSTITTTASGFSGRNGTTGVDSCACSALTTCKILSGGGHHCECKKVGDTNLCLYELLIILGILAIAAVTSCVVWYLVVRRKRKVRDTKAIHSEKKDTRETSQRKD